uniref:C-type lectin domain-containing protein n=1 Tax=Seriola lalandi dorsalis TaxID=1841481 RepID=A0A3B4X210_SERLL
MSFEETCTSVPLQHSPWWQVDLGSIYHITALSVNSFGDCCPEQLDGAEVYIELKRILSQLHHTFICIAIAEFFFFLTTGYCASASCSRDLILVHDQPKTWSEGQTYCREKYADLVTISNAQDMNKVIDFMNEDVDNFWIGLYEDVLTWSWSLSDVSYYGDGETEFRNWDAGEPNSQSGIQHCLCKLHVSASTINLLVV